jgi:FtsZ-interacting cell division protein YlmF
MAFFSKRPKNGYNSYDDDYDNSFNRGDYEGGDDGVIDGFEETEPVRSAPAQPAPAQPVAPAAPAVSSEPEVQPAAASGGFALFKPRGYQDAPDIVRYMKNTGCGTVLDIEDVEATEAQRLIIFMLGALEAMGGELKRVNKTTFILSTCKGVLRDGTQS